MSAFLCFHHLDHVCIPSPCSSGLNRTRQAFLTLSLSLHFTFATTRPRTFFAVMYPINTPANCVILCSRLRLVLIPVSWPTTRKRSPRVFGHRRRCCDYPETRRWQREVATGGSDGGSTVDAGWCRRWAWRRWGWWLVLRWRRSGRFSLSESAAGCEEWAVDTGPGWRSRLGCWPAPAPRYTAPGHHAEGVQRVWGASHRSWGKCMI